MHFLKTEILQNIFPFLKNLLIEIGFFFYMISYLVTYTYGSLG